MPDLKAARENLRELLTDLQMLKGFADVGNPESEEFVAALVAAREKAKVAAREYVQALR